MKNKIIAIIAAFCVLASMEACFLPNTAFRVGAADSPLKTEDEVFIENPADELTDEAALEMAEMFIDEITGEVVFEMPEEAAEKVTVEAAVEADAEAAEEVTDEAAVEAAEETAEEVTVEAAVETDAEAAEEVTDEAAVETAEEAADEVTDEGSVKAANFLGADGETVLSCPVGSTVAVSAIMEAFGLSGEITSLVCDSDAVEIILNEDGTYDVKINEAFADAKLLFTVDGNEIEIPVHDPDQVNSESSLKDLINKINSGADNTEPVEIQLTDNITLSGNGGITIGKGKNVIIDLNGFTLKNAVNEDKGSQVILNNGTLVIKDTSADQSGKIMNDVEDGAHAGEWWGTVQYNYASNVITNQGDLTIEGGTIEQTASGSICYAVDNNSNVRDATLTLNGGVLESSTTTVRQFCQTGGENAVIINGGTIEGSTGIWVQLPGSSGTTQPEVSLTINGGTIDASSYAFYDYSYGNAFNNVDFEINGGEINGYVFSYGANTVINGGEFSDDIFIYKDKGGSYPAYDNNVEVNGGCFAGDVSVYDYKGGSTPYYAKDVIKGGAFNDYSDGTEYYDWVYSAVSTNELMNNYDPETMDEYPFILGLPVEVKFVNWDGEELFKDIMAEGYVVSYPGETPTKPADDTYTYEFIGWDISLSNPVEKDTMFTAVFKAVPINPQSEPQSEPQPESQANGGNIVIECGSEENSARYQGTISGNEVTVIIPSKEEISEILKAADKPAPVVVDCSGVGAAINKVTLPGTLIEAVNENSDSVTGLQIEYSGSSVTLDKKALASNAVKNADSLTVALEKTAKNKAEEAVKADETVQKEVGDQPEVIAVYDCYMIIDNAVVRALDGGSALICIDENQIPAKDFKVYAMDENGKLTPVEYKIVDGQIQFEVDELQTYIFVK